MNAGERKCDVYAGIDVFGRNTFGGGGLTCDVACAAIKSAGVSTAIFAPGWVFEDDQFDNAAFDANSVRFWSQFRCFKGEAVTGLPFCTSFDAGRGTMFAVDGCKVSTEPWANLNSVGIHPTIAYDARVNPYFLGGGRPEWGCLPPSFALDYTRAYSGGASLMFEAGKPLTLPAVEAAPTGVYRLYVYRLV
jgi:endo-beta-N-acetylglucosaminidase D